MPKIKLLYPRKLGDGKTFKEYAKGVHDIDQATFDHWFTQAEMKSGVVTNPFDVKTGAASGVPTAIHQKLIADCEALKKENAELKKENAGLKEDLDSLMDGKKPSPKKVS